MPRLFDARPAHAPGHQITCGGIRAPGHSAGVPPHIHDQKFRGSLLAGNARWCRPFTTHRGAYITLRRVVSE